MAGVIGGRLLATHHHHHRHTTLISTPLSQFNINLPAIHSHRASTMSASATPPTTALNNLTVQHPPTPTGCWSEFAGNVSGEWDGFGADFTIDGKPIELPENVVPNAYREWEVRVFDWQIQCPTLVQPDNKSGMYKLIKLLPTVGCEADAATRFSVDEKIIGGADNMVSSFAYQSNGCYTAVWSTQKSESLKVLELEHCLIDPRDKESRVRIIQIVGVEGNQKLVLKNIKVFVELWYGKFRNGDQLGGCAIRNSAFATTEALDGSKVLGVWQQSNSVARFQESPNILQELVAVDGIVKTVRAKEGLVLLPKNLWSSMVEIGEKTCCEVGWLLEPGRTITSKCVFSRNAELKEIIVSSETAA